jgi:hypothetical protein
MVMALTMHFADALVRDYATKRYWGAHDEALASREMAESVLGFHLL